MTHVFRVTRKENKGIPPVLHPTLAALYIVLHSKGDLSDIGRNHPCLEDHNYFKPKAQFPNDILDLLPPREDCRWEVLATQSCQAAKVPPISVLPWPKVRLILLENPDNSAQDVEMEADDLEVDEIEEDKSEEDERVVESQGCKRGGKAAEAANSRKWKGTLPHKTHKHRAVPSQVDPEPEKGSEAGRYKFECDRCLRTGVACEPDPTHLCKRCQHNKKGCSLMPVNRNTGKTDQHNLTEAGIFHFCVSQLKNQKKQKASLDLESWSSHSPPTASNSPSAATTSESPALPSQSPPAPAAYPTRVPAPHAVKFYVEVPTPTKAANKAPIGSHAPSAAASVTHTTAAATVASIPVATDLSAAVVTLPVATDLPAVAAATATSTVSAISAPAIPSTVVSPSVSVPLLFGQQSIPAAGSSSPAIAPALCQHLKPCEVWPSSTSLAPSLDPTDPSSLWQLSGADNIELPPLGNLAERVLLLERRMEEWSHRDETWKEGLNCRRPDSDD
ncbi:hypothetical protein V8E53_014023 [Lactarius tabidus]